MYGGWFEVLGFVGGSSVWNGWEILEYWIIWWMIYGWVGIEIEVLVNKDGR